MAGCETAPHPAMDQRIARTRASRVRCAGLQTPQPALDPRLLATPTPAVPTQNSTEASWIYLDEHRFGHNPRPNPLERALQVARRAVELAPDEAMAHWNLAKVYFFRKELAQFTAEMEKALTLNPHNAELIANVAIHIGWLGRTDEAYDLTKKAIRLDPHPPGWYHVTIAFYHYLRREDEQALAELEQADMPSWHVFHGWRAMILGRLGRIEEAREAAQEALRLMPGFSLVQHYRKYNVSEETLRQFQEGLSGTGLT
jgi:tetratricopeptide (TPR) repeat protein